MIEKWEASLGLKYRLVVKGVTSVGRNKIH